jgi:hypothetical protein
MAYKYIARYSCADRDDALTKIWSMLSNMGWTLVDSQDGSFYRVYSSNGELSDRITEYMQFRWDIAGQINLRAWYRWDGGSITAGQGSCYWTNINSVSTSETGFYLWMHGDKNIFVITTRVGALYYQSGGGHLPTRAINVVASFLNAESSGSNVVVEVDDVTGFTPGSTYMVVGSNKEGRIEVTVNAVNISAETLTITNLNTNYAAGTLIGHSPSTFGVFRSGLYYFCMTCTKHTTYDVLADITSGNILCVAYDPLESTRRDPDYRTGLYAFAPIAYYVNDFTTMSVNYQSLFGYLDQHILDAPPLTTEDIYTVWEKTTGIATAIATDNTLTDSGGGWTVNEYSGKALVIRFGRGVGQIRKIVSNTSTVLTLDANWDIPIDTTSQYIVCDAAYRGLEDNNASSPECAFREGY